mmetsp:Transcript_20155/g.47174  ORF Transcript_20155/g.47174 Transcript_20155/m.47174 type:complete len:1119 (-) Transcript_20155:115-3471(-)
MRRTWRVEAALILVLACCSSAELFQDDAVAHIQIMTVKQEQQRLANPDSSHQQLAFETGQELEVNVFGSKWVNCTIVAAGTKVDTYDIHVPSFPQGHQDLANVKAVTLRDPMAERKRQEWKAAEEAKRKADEEARKKAEDEAKQAAEDEERRLAELMAHTFEIGENVEVKSAGKDGNLTWVKATVVGKGNGPRKYNINVKGTNISNINYLALRKDAAHHFEVGEHAEVKTKGGQPVTWVKCIIMGKGDESNTYHIHVPAAPKNKRNILNVPVRSLRKEPMPVWSPRFEAGELMEVFLKVSPNKSTWVRCNVTGKAIKVETYHIQVLNNATGYRLENVSAALLRETQEGLNLLNMKKARLLAQKEALHKAEEEKKRLAEEAEARRRYALRKLEEEEVARAAEEEAVKKDPLLYVTVQARKKAQTWAQERKEAMERQKQREELEVKRVAEIMENRKRHDEEERRNRQWQQTVEPEGEGWIIEVPKAQESNKAFQEFVQYEQTKRGQAEERQRQVLMAAERQGLREEEEAQRRQAAREARLAVEKERQRKRQEEERLRQQHEAKLALERALLSTGNQFHLVMNLRTAIHDANRTGLGAEELLKPRKTLLWALWNTTVVKLRRAISSRYVMELQKALMDGQAASLEITRLRKLITLGEAKLKGDQAVEEEPFNDTAFLLASTAANSVRAEATLSSVSAALTQTYEAPELQGIPEFAEAESILREEGHKWSAYFHLQDAERTLNLDELEKAIQEANETNITQGFILEGQAIHSVLAALRAADRTGETEQLREAISKAEQFVAFSRQFNFTANMTAWAVAVARKAVADEEARGPIREEVHKCLEAHSVECLDKVVKKSGGLLRKRELEDVQHQRRSLMAEKKAHKQEELAELRQKRKADKEAKRLERLQAKQKAKEEAEQKAKELAEQRAQAAREAAEERAKQVRMAQEAAERKAKLAQEAAERKAKLAQEAAERKARDKHEATELQARLAREAALRKAKEEQEAAEQRALAEEARKVEARLAAEQRAKADEEARIKAEEERRAQEEAERAKEEAEQKAREEAELKAREEAERRAVEADRRAQEAADRKAREAERKAAEARAEKLAIEGRALAAKDNVLEPLSL